MVIKVQLLIYVINYSLYITDRTHTYILSNVFLTDMTLVHDCSRLVLPGLGVSGSLNEVAEVGFALVQVSADHDHT